MSEVNIPLPAKPAPAPDKVEIPDFTGRGVRLRPIQKEDYPFLWELRADPEFAYLWMQGRNLPSFEAYCNDLEYALSTHVISLMVVETLNDRRPVGIMYAYDYNQLDGYAYLTMAFHPAYTRTTWAGEAYLIYNHYLFSFLNIRKLYSEVYEFNQPVIKVLTRIRWQVEGVFKQQRYFAGKYWNTVCLALTREDWVKHYDHFGSFVNSRVTQQNK